MRTFDSGTVVAEIAGNTYHLPAALTPGLRIKAHKALTAYTKALDQRTLDERDYVLALQQGEGKTAESIADASAAAEKALEASATKIADAARGVVLALITAPAGAAVPDDVGDHVADAAALEYVQTLTARGRVEVDPQ